jgi:hypothetical protein
MTYMVKKMHHCFILIAYNNRCEFNMVFLYFVGKNQR